VDEAMDRVRNLALALRPSVLDDLGLAAALRWYVDRFSRETGMETHLSIDVVAKLDPLLEITCFRLVQESMTNVARHAHATQVWIDVQALAGDLVLKVRDDGTGFDAAAARASALQGVSLGLLGMEERASLAGGRLQIGSKTGEGTEVNARFPLRNSAQPTS
jgi:signal transduction histidine kinase